MITLSTWNQTSSGQPHFELRKKVTTVITGKTLNFHIEKHHIYKIQHEKMCPAVYFKNMNAKSQV
jgi:hypothetical protein